MTLRGSIATDTMRRQILIAGGWMGLTGCLVGAPGARGEKPATVQLGPVRTECVLEDGDVFTEGPAMGPDGAVYFTNMRLNRIMRYALDTRELTVFRENSDGANGLAFDADGGLLICEGAKGRIARLDIATGRHTVLADSFDGRPIVDVNDLTLDAKGRIYFSSRPKHFDADTGNVNTVYRLDPDGAVSRLLAWPDVDMPNGLAISPDQKTLYLIDADAKAGKRRQIDAFDLAEDGTLGQRRLINNFYPGRSGDGMCLDAAGHLYVAAGLHAERGTSETLDTRPGIHVFSPSGEKLGYRETPEDTVTNCTFGHGAYTNTLFVTCGRRLLSIDVASDSAHGA